MRQPPALQCFRDSSASFCFRKSLSLNSDIISLSPCQTRTMTSKPIWPYDILFCVLELLPLEDCLALSSISKATRTAAFIPCFSSLSFRIYNDNNPKACKALKNATPAFRNSITCVSSSQRFTWYNLTHPNSKGKYTPPYADTPTRTPGHLLFLKCYLAFQTSTQF